ncbi:DNA polymerase III subunit delta [Aquibium oceanicum]|uniref:DNA polymerase III subunit delta n=1 Tax=Aquibium oceanicum TaxID=1670800 RepID=A0A1L3SLJ1_9HYPH|nr:DNA polymerase III subunit delta [Aquibium oceanicum]APH70266.1 DNA polymerase III subunit delta [Aquibium oceanicum]
MAQKKSHEVDGWLSRPDSGTAVVLIYGSDRGLVSERAKRFSMSTGLDPDDPFSVVKLEASDIDSDPGRLADEANTVSMFGGRRLIWVRNAGAQKGLVSAVKALVETPPRDTVVLIEAGELKKGSPLRSSIEIASAAMALPCYADEGRSLDQLLDSQLQEAGASISLEARQLLKSHLGGDRLASRGEIEKLLLYCAGEKQIDVEDVIASTGDVSGVTGDQVVDAMLQGEYAEMDSRLQRAFASGTAPFSLVSSAMRQFQALSAMRADMDRNGKAAASVVASARPPVFYARKRIIENALGRWTTEALAAALDRLQQAVLATRRRPELAPEIVRQSLLALAVTAARGRG